MTNNCSYYCKLTERRLFAYNDLSAKLEIDLAQLQELKKEGVILADEDSGILFENESIFSPKIIWEKKTEGLKNQIAEGMRELSRLDDAINAVSGDFYGDIIKLKYIEGKSDEYIAEALNCDVSTVRRNRKRILKRMAVRLYGCNALAV